MPKIYLDACCVNRPFDDQSQGRARLESEAILLIVSLMEQEGWPWIGSEVLSFELERIPDPERRRKAQTFVRGVSLWVPLDRPELARATSLEGLGLDTFDALHLASAESGGAAALLTTDDRFVKRAQRIRKALALKVANPLAWYQEISEHGEGSS